MKLRKEYITTRDIDWFCRINNIWIHAASASGELPNKVNNNKSLPRIQHLVSQLPDIFDIEQLLFNESFLYSRFNNSENRQEQESNYLDSFISMAKKGFSSFDRTNLGNIFDNKYHFVVRPKNEFILQINFELLLEHIPSYTILEVDILNQQIVDMDLPKLINKQSR